MKKHKTLEYYVTHYIKREISKHMNLDFAFYFKEFLTNDDYRMLDIGCAIDNFLANDPQHIIGVDVSKNLLKIAKTREFNVVCVDVEDGLCFKNESFDAVHASYIIEHLDNSIFFLKKCYRILESNGLLVVITEDFSKVYKIFYDDPTHKHPLTKVSLKKCAEEVGFKKFFVNRQFVPTGMNLLIQKGLISLEKALAIAKILYKLGIYKHRKGTLALVARK